VVKNNINLKINKNMKSLQHSLGFLTSNNNYNKLTEIQKENLEMLNNDKTILSYLNIKTNYKYWSTERVENEINNNLKNKQNEKN
jgi:hypothetical protein